MISYAIVLGYQEVSDSCPASMLAPYPSYTTYTHEREVLSETLQVSDYAHGDALNTEYARGSALREILVQLVQSFYILFVYLTFLYS